MACYIVTNLVLAYTVSSVSADMIFTTIVFSVAPEVIEEVFLASVALFNVMAEHKA